MSTISRSNATMASCWVASQAVIWDSVVMQSPVSFVRRELAHKAGGVATVAPLTRCGGRASGRGHTITGHYVASLHHSAPSWPLCHRLGDGLGVHQHKIADTPIDHSIAFQPQCARATGGD